MDQNDPHVGAGKKLARMGLGAARTAARGGGDEAVPSGCRSHRAARVGQYESLEERIMSDETNQQDATTRKKGGFGAFWQQYRDRWAANHPNAKKASVDDSSAPTSALDAPAADAPLPYSGTQS